MTRQEHLLTILAEECAEVAQRATKALRFGLKEVQPGQHIFSEKDNARRVTEEFADLFAVYSMLVAEDLIPSFSEEQVLAKRAKVERYLAYSRECGTLEGA